MRARPALPVFLAVLMLAASSSLAAAQGERFMLEGGEVAIYNLAGTLHAEGGTGDRVVIEVTRGGRDAARLKLDASQVRGHAALRVLFPDERIVYPRLRDRQRMSFEIRDDGTFGSGDRGRDGWRGRRRIEVRSDGDGIEAWADLRVIVPRGKVVHLNVGVGETTIDNIDGELHVDIAASHVRVARVRGALSLSSGSGGAEISDITGDVTLESGSGGATIENVSGGSLSAEVGSGSLRGRNIKVRELKAEIGSGGIRLAAVHTPRLHLETGSGGSDIELLDPIDDVSVEAGSGGVTLRLPTETSATVLVTTGSGGIDSQFDIRTNKLERNTLRGTIGTGRGRIRVEAGSGTVRLLRS